MGTETAAATITVTVLLASLGLKVTDFAKFLTNAARGDATAKKRAHNDIATFFVSWLVGFVTVVVLKETAWAAEITIGSKPLSGLSWGNLLLFGLVFSTAAGTLYDFKKAIDGNDTAKKPPLLPDTPPTPMAADTH